MSPSKDEAPPPKIAIKGFSLSSKSTPNSSKPGTPKPTLGKRPRSTFAAHDSDSDDESRHRVKAEVVTGFGANGAIKHTERKVEGPLVIPKIANRDWKGEKRHRGEGTGKNLLPPEVQAAREAARKERDGRNGEGKTEGVDVVNSNDGEIQWGLSVRKREPAHSNFASAQQETQDQDQEVGASKTEELQEQPSKPKTDDELALASLLGQDTKPKGPDLIITSTSTTTHRMTEEEQYRRDLAAAPDVSTLEDYERVPVEEFGAALLRGMGWDGKFREASGNGGKKEEKRGRRQNLLGLGAKELKEAEELGAWVSKSDVKRLKSAGESKGRGDRPPKLSDYRREKEERQERRREGGYRDERERERSGGHRDRGYERDGYRDRERDRRR